MSSNNNSDGVHLIGTVVVIIILFIFLKSISFMQILYTI